MIPTFDQMKALRTNRKALEQALEQAGAEFKGSAIRCPFHDDQHPSGSIYQGTDNAWRFKCHACTWNGDIIDVQKEVQGELRREPKPKTNGRTMSQPEQKKPMSLEQVRHWIAEKCGPIEFEYPYCNVKSNEIMRMFRFIPHDGSKPKDFLPARREGDGYVIKQLEKPWPLYRLPELIRAEIITVCEGEKAADALTKYNIIATSGPHGAGKAGYVDWKPLAGKKVILWPDADDEGRKHMVQVAEILRDLTPKPDMKILDPADLDLGHKEDAFDYVQQNKILSRHVRAGILRALGKAKRQSPAQGLRKLIEDTASGKREAVHWPWRRLSHLSRALLPGTVTLVCGDPGATKSFFLLQCLAYWLELNISCCVFELEDDRSYHLNRVLAQRSQCADLFDPEWVKANSEQAKAAFMEYEDFLDGFGDIISEAPDNQVTLDELAEWIRKQGKSGRRIIALDPVTAAVQTDKPWIADTKFLMAAKTAVRESGASLILVTHPKKGNRGAVGIDDLAGGAAYQRFAHSILWIERHKEPKSSIVKTEVGRIQMDVNRTIHICKARNGPGAGLQLAYKFDGSSLLFAEQGIITKG